MAKEPEPEFVVTDRRKFSAEGERLATTPDNSERPSEEKFTSPAAAAPSPMSPSAAPAKASQSAGSPAATADLDQFSAPDESELDQTELPPVTEAETKASNDAYQQSSRHLDDLVKANNPAAAAEGGMTFERLVQSLYLTAMLQMGAATPEGQQARVDILGARQTIDTLGILSEKTKGNLIDKESRLLQSALFELRMTFLELTNAIATNAANPGKP